jgi:hypothetical protein
MVIARSRENDRLGLMRETMFNPRAGTATDAVVVRCHKSKDRRAKHAVATFFIVNYCPFCGKQLEKKGAKRG